MNPNLHPQYNHGPSRDEMTALANGRTLVGVYAVVTRLGDNQNSNNYFFTDIHRNAAMLSKI